MKEWFTLDLQCYDSPQTCHMEQFETEHCNATSMISSEAKIALREKCDASSLLKSLNVKIVGWCGDSPGSRVCMVKNTFQHTQPK